MSQMAVRPQVLGFRTRFRCRPLVWLSKQTDLGGMLRASPMALIMYKPDE